MTNENNTPCITFEKMRKLLLIWCCFLGSSLPLVLFAQNPSSPRPSASNASRDFEEYLVQIAIANNPDLQAVTHKKEIDAQEILLAKKDWLKNSLVGVNINESNLPYFMVNTLDVRTLFGREIDLARIPNIVTYPLWNVGVGINISDMVNRKHKIKIAQERQKITDTEGVRRRTEIRAKVLQRYQKYLMAYEIYKIRLQALDIAETNQKNVSELFKVNKAKLEDYSSANKIYFDALEGKAKAETDIKIARFDLEEVLGVKWEQVAKNENKQ